PSQHTLVCGVAGRPAMAFRIDHALTLGLVDGVLGKYDAPSSESAESPLTVTERRILVSVLKSALGAVAPLVFPALFADLLPAATVLQIIGARDEAGVIADTLEPAEPLIAMTAPYVINGRRGAIALGLTAAPAVGTQRLRLTLGEILDELELGASLRLDRHAGDPVEVYVNGALFARAEVVVMQDQIGAKIIELVEAPPASRPSGLR
ncbi:MAG: FliM/FliN family flagellar motor switch protein, partial [Candidatus Binataceae bacterium]